MIQIENRTHRRLNATFFVGVSVVSGIRGWFKQNPLFECLTRDVSIRGMKIVSGQPLSAGAAVNLWITLPEESKGEAIRLRGRVCWATPQTDTGKYVAGIQVGDGPARSVAIWAEAIRERICVQFRNDSRQESMG